MADWQPVGLNQQYPTDVAEPSQLCSESKRRDAAPTLKIPISFPKKEDVTFTGSGNMKIDFSVLDELLMDVVLKNSLSKQ